MQDVRRLSVTRYYCVETAKLILKLFSAVESDDVSCNVARVSCNVARVSCNVAGVSCNVAHVSCNVSGVSCNVARVSCNAARVSRTLLLQDVRRLSVTRYYCVETTKLVIILFSAVESDDVSCNVARVLFNVAGVSCNVAGVS